MNDHVLLKTIKLLLLLVFSVVPFKIDQNQNRSIDKVQNLGNERRYKYKDPRQDSGQSSNMADGNQQKHLLPSFATKA